jgi:hypothetical protein
LAGRTDTGQTDTGQTDTARTGTARTDIGRTDTGWTDTGWTDTGRTDTGRTDTGRTSTGRTSTGRTGQTDGADTERTGRARSETGGHRLQAPRPGSGSPTGDTARLPAAAAGAGSRPDRPGADRPPGRRAHARARRTKRPGRVLLACGLVLALVAGGAAYLWLSSGHKSAGQAAATPKQSALPPPKPQTASPSPSLGPWGHIETRATDPLALTLAELFPGKFSASGATYARTIERDGTNCAKAVIGSALQSAVEHGKCSQVMRASYLSGNGKVMGTIGVLNLINVTAAEKSGKAAGGADFIDQLPAAKGPTRHLTKGTGLEETEIKGHYLVMVWAEFANLHAPKTKGQRLELEAFCNHLIQNTANLSLASRLVTGKPRVP